MTAGGHAAIISSQSERLRFSTKTEMIAVVKMLLIKSKVNA